MGPLADDPRRMQRRGGSALWTFLMFESFLRQVHAGTIANPATLGAA